MKRKSRRIKILGIAGAYFEGDVLRPVHCYDSFRAVHSDWTLPKRSSEATLSAL